MNFKFTLRLFSFLTILIILYSCNKDVIDTVSIEKVISYEENTKLDSALLISNILENKLLNTKNLKDLSLLYNINGRIYKKLNNPEEAMFYFKKSLNLRKNLGLDSLVPMSYGNIAIIYSHKDMIDSALIYSLLAINDLTRQKDTAALANFLNNHGWFLYMNKSYPEAIEFYNRAYKLNKSIKSETKVALNMLNSATAFFALEKNDTAQYLYNQASSYASEKNELSLLRECYIFGIKLNKELKNYKVISEIMEALWEIDSKMYGNNKEQTIEKFKSEISNLNQQIELDKKNNRIIINLLISFILFITIVSVSIIYYRDKSRLSRLLKKSTSNINKLVYANKHAKQRSVNYKLINTEMMNFVIVLEKKMERFARMEDNFSVKRELLNCKREMSSFLNNIAQITIPDKEEATEKSISGDTDADFLIKLSEVHPNLTKLEKKLCVYFKLNFDTNVIASQLGVESRTISIYKYRLKKKLHNETAFEDLHKYLNSIDNLNIEELNK